MLPTRIITETTADGDVVETVEQRHQRRWDEIKQGIRERKQATRGEQLLILRYCQIYGGKGKISAEVIWMLQAGVPLATIIPELKCREHSHELRKTVQGWLDRMRRCTNATPPSHVGVSVAALVG